MSTVLIQKFDGGHAEDVRTSASDQSEQSLNFDIFKEPFRLNPIPDTVAETLNGGLAMDTSRVFDTTIANINGTDYIVGAGYKGSGSSVELTFYTKTNVTDPFTTYASASGSTYIPGSLITYKTRAYAVDYNSSNTFRLIRLDTGAATSVGNISYTRVGAEPVLCFIHPEDNILYVIIGNTISKWDGSTLTTGGGYSTILPANYTAQSVTNYGGYLAIVVNPVSGNAKPVCLLWGRDGTLTTLQGTLDLGEGYCGIVENLDNNLVFVLSPYINANITGVTPTDNKIIVKGYAGGAVEILKELSTSSPSQIYTVKAKKNNRLYFASPGLDSIWVFGKNKEGQYTLTNDIFIINGSAIVGSRVIYGISIIGDTFWVAQETNTVFTLQRITTTYTSTSTYKTTINPNMPLGDRYKDKSLVSVQIAVTGAATGTTGLKYSVDGSTMTSIISQSNSTGEHVHEATGQADGQVFLTGREFQFQLESSGGAKIKEIRYRYETLNQPT